ncbi:heat-shock protein [Nostoc linckia FACHB-104]|nr:heat-shock protein [Nostoc linckia FACHB-104]
MSKNFNTIKTEVIQWKNFTYNNEVFDLSHLNAHWVKYCDERNESKPITYKFIVTYGSHCFTTSQEVSGEESPLLMYHAPRESRPFDVERYSLSKYLPNIIHSLADKTTLVCHAGYGNFATVKVVDSNSRVIDYFVVFTVFRENRKLRLHVMSAYPKYDGIGKVKKVSFLVIAKNLLANQQLPRP